MMIRKTMQYHRPPLSCGPARVWFELRGQKELLRSGWLRAGVPAGTCESVADHSHGVALLALLLLTGPAYRALDRGRVLAMAALHDAGEVLTGDYTPGEIDPAAKHLQEAAAVRSIFGKLPGDAGREYIALWEEYERGESPEARFVRQLDRLEMALQAAIYRQSAGIDVAEFLDSARDAVTDAPLRDILRELGEALR